MKVTIEIPDDTTVFKLNKGLTDLGAEIVSLGPDAANTKTEPLKEGDLVSHSDHYASARDSRHWKPLQGFDRYRGKPYLVDELWWRYVRRKRDGVLFGPPNPNAPN